MRRRTFLGTVLAAGLAGCTAPASDETPGATTTVAGPTVVTPPEPDPEREPFQAEGSQLVTAAATDRVYALGAGGGGGDEEWLWDSFQFVSEPDADGPALVEGTLTNEGDFERVIAFEELSLFDGTGWFRPDGYLDVSIPGRERDFVHLLEPTAAHDFADRESSFHRDGEGVWRVREHADHDIPDYLRLAPGQTIYGQWALVADTVEFDGRVPVPGRYSTADTSEVHLSIGIWDRTAPGPSEESIHAGRDVPPPPPAREDVTKRVWYHEAGPETPVFLHPETEAGTLPLRVDFTLVNHTVEQAFGLNPYNWGLYKLHDDMWYHIAPQNIPLPGGSLQPGSIARKTHTLFNGRRLGGPPGFDDTDDSYRRTVPYLGPGLYAYARDLMFEDTYRCYAALLELDGDPVAVTPATDLSIERGGDTIEAVHPEVDTSRRNHRLTVERAPEAETDERVLPEQIMTVDYATGLRNAIGLLEPGVGTVRLETPTYEVSIAGDIADRSPVILESPDGPVTIRVGIEDLWE
ncbi:hypothetical protein [Halorhabdus sp. BNX81]|uniref:hypothetical protein n=1 Tax=Halorhabdus sp. BNX81 TaxID=2980181 RepID=UPI0023DD50BB|nr:hypothetical protein [Halorhabdus sp. BNX81]WEL22631.1 Uncharacterized protein HBNXHr_2591 [Halorhabdus sp. BNX81]